MNDRKNKIEQVIDRLSTALGVELSFEEVTSVYDFDYRVRLTAAPHPYGFSFYIGDDYFAWNIKFESDSEASELINSMRKRAVLRVDQVISHVEIARSKSTNFLFSLNGNSLEFPKSEMDFLHVWHEIRVELTQAYNSADACFDSLYSAMLDAMCIVLELIIVDQEWRDQNDDPDESGWHAEGGSSQRLVTKYERSRFNRALCLRFYGFECRGCGDLMSEIYGPVADNVIHVHHIVPVSRMGGSYILNPIKDLIPLCPNCHNVVHQVDPPMGIEELRQLRGYQLS